MIKNTGITRRIDNLGRICVPIELRRILTGNKDVKAFKVHIYMDNENKDKLIIKQVSEDETGVIRPVDDCGRLSIPIESRRLLNLDIEDSVAFFTDADNKEILIKKYNHRCVFCKENDTDNLKMYDGKFICKKCIEAIKKL